MSIDQLGKASDTAFDVTNTTVTDDMATNGTTTILNVAEAGRIISIAMQIKTSVNANTTGVLEITIDGGTKRSIPTWTASVTWQRDGFAPYSQGGGGLQGDTQHDQTWMPFNTHYKSSLLIEHVVSSTTATLGEVDISVLKGTAL